MIGNQYLIAGNPERIVSYHFAKSSVRLVTDKRTREFDEHQLMNFLKDSCMPMEEDFSDMHEVAVHHPSGNELSRPAAHETVVYQPSFNNNHFKELREILKSNIEKVQESKEYLPQAVAVRDNVQSIIDLTKNEIDYMKTVNRLNR